MGHLYHQQHQGIMREKSGKGIRRKVVGQNKVASNWPDLLHDSTNKQEHFNFLSKKVSLTGFPDDKQIFIISGTTVIGRGASHSMQLCGHEEADTRILVHLQDALANGSTTCLVCTVDTDVVVIIIGKLCALLTKHPTADMYGLPLGLARTLHTFTLMLSVMPWKNASPCHFLFFTTSLAVIEHQHSWGKGRSQHGRPGIHIQR